MDNRSEVRDFLTSRRARLTPKDAGLPTLGAARRVKGLRREEVATLAGVSVEYYSRMERGGLGGVSESVLEAVAAALQLDDAERAHLFDLARTANAGQRPRRTPARARVRPAVQLLLDGMTDLPAYVRNGWFDILAVNRLGAALLPDLALSGPGSPNMARYLFLDHRAQECARPRRAHGRIVEGRSPNWASNGVCAGQRYTTRTEGGRSDQEITTPAACPAPSGIGEPDRGDDKRRRCRHVFRPVPLRYGITRSGQVQAAPQGSPSRNLGVFSVESHDRSRT